MSKRRSKAGGHAADDAAPPVPVVVYVPRHRAHPARWGEVVYDVRYFDPAGDAEADRAGRKALGLPEPVRQEG